MGFQFSLLFLPHALAAIINAILVIILLNRPKSPTITALTWLAANMSAWAGVLFFYLMVTDLSVKVVLDGIALGLAYTLPFAVFALSWCLTGHGSSINHKFVGGVIIVGITFAILGVTNPSHGLVWSTYDLVERNGFLSTSLTRTPLIYISTAVVYAVMFAGQIHMVIASLQAPRERRRQYLALTVALMVPVSINALVLGNMIPNIGFNVTPATLSISGVLLGWLAYRQRLFDLLPVARAYAFDAVEDAIFIVNSDGIIVDANPAARTAINVETGTIIGQPVSTFLPHTMNPLQKERPIVILGVGAAKKEYELRMTQVETGGGHAGQLIVLRDITEQRRFEHELRHQAQHDSLTGLKNRRGFLNALSQSKGRPFGVIILDLDGFKQANDLYGHAAGDSVLATVGRRLEEIVSQRGVVARLGGDEFAVLLSGQQAVTLVEPLALVIKRSFTNPVRYGNHLIRVGASVGHAMTKGSESANSVMGRADTMMYAQKGEQQDDQTMNRPPLSSIA